MRQCIKCGSELSDFSSTYAGKKLRALLSEIPERPAKPGESYDQRREGEAAWNSSQLIHARVVLGALADDADGYCVTCAPSMQAHSERE
jgi:hypothetical protein